MSVTPTATVTPIDRHRKKRDARADLARRLEGLTLAELACLGSAIILASTHRIDQPLAEIAGFVAQALEVRSAGHGGTL